VTGTGDRGNDRSRGQAYTLEGIIAAILIATALLYGLQTTDVAAWTSSTSTDRAESLRQEADDLLAAAADNDTLSHAVRCINGTTGQVLHPGLGAPPPNNATMLGSMLNRSFGDREITYELHFVYRNDTTGRRESLLVYPPLPKSRDVDAVNASHRVAIFDNMSVSNRTAALDTRNCRTEDGTVGDASAGDRFYAPDSDSSDLYNVVEVRLVVW
jgi:hypothetical protein